METFNDIEELRKHDDLYYNEDAEISDSAYDILKESVRTKYPDNSYFSMVGSPVRIKNKKVKLPYILGSLNKVQTEKDIIKWYDPKETYIASEKLDGISIFVKYVDDKLVQAITRGNGVVGQDITDKAKVFCPVPKNNIGVLELRGEILLPGNKYVEMGKKNRRNACAGLINQKGTENCEYLIVKFYELIFTSNLLFVSRKSELQRLKKISLHFEKENLPRVKIFPTGTMTIDALTSKLNEWKKETNWDIDGIVITKENSERENIYYPKDKIAFKVNHQAILTEVVGCKWETSRMGKIKPFVY